MKICWGKIKRGKF